MLIRLFLLGIIVSNYIFANAHIFVYHRFGDSKHKSTSTSIEELKSEFNYFRDNGYKIVRLSDILEKIEKKEIVPDNWIALTIDDSYKSFYQNGLKVFKEFGYPFTLFVYVKATDKRYNDFMSWDELKEAKKSGDIQLHTYNHPHLVSLNDDEIKKDTQKGIEVFTKKMGYKPTLYAYPFGEYDNRVQNIIKDLGFRAILNQNSGAIIKDSDIYDIDRIALVGEVNLKSKLKIKALNANFLAPIDYPKDDFIKNIKIKIDEDIKECELYITDYGWHKVKVIDGLIDFKLDKKLKKERVRLIVKAKNSTIKTKILVKGE